MVNERYGLLAQVISGGTRCTHYSQIGLANPQAFQLSSYSLRKVDVQLCVYRDGFAVFNVRPKLPRAHRIVRSGSKHRVSPDNVQRENATVLADNDSKGNPTLNASDLRVRWVIRLD